MKLKDYSKEELEAMSYDDIAVMVLTESKKQMKGDFYMAFLDETGATILADEVKTYVGNTAVAKETGKGLSTNDYTTAEKNKLAGIVDGANKTIVDSTLNASSENPVQNKVVKGAVDEIKQDLGNLRFSLTENNLLHVERKE